MRLTNGFGTVKVVMLKGEQGIRGEQGIQGEQGSQGEPFEFEDFTEQQLAELRADVASVYYKKDEATYYTVGENTTTIEIPFSSYRTTDMLFVNIEGLTLAQGNDYTISGSNIVLTKPITHHHTAVNFMLLTAMALSTEDMEGIFTVDTTVTSGGTNPVTGGAIYNYVASAIADITNGDGVSY